MRIEFRPWKKGDEKSLVLHANNINIWNNVRDCFPHPYTMKDARDWVRKNETIKPALNIAIVVDGNAVGGIGIQPGRDIHKRNAEIGYWIGEEYWGKGIVSKAVKWMVDYTFKNFNVVRIYASTFNSNIASQKVLEKAGFTREAILKKALFKNNFLLDEYHYSLLKKDL